MPKPLRTKKIEQPSARPRTVEAKVSSPTVPGATETVRRVINTIEYMLARKQLDRRSYRVAEMLLGAHQVLYGSIGNNLDPDRISGSSSPGSPPPPTYLLAAERLSEAKRFLFPKAYRIVVSVVIAGYTIEQTANELAGGIATRYEKEETGKTLREGLATLAARWIPDHEEAQSGAIVGFRAPEKPTISVGLISRGKTVHATGRRVFREG